MKIRNGFVSNSSSSSFIVTDKNKKTIDILKEMFNHLHEYEWDKKDIRLKMIDSFISTKPDDFDEPIHIPFTCNYETFIFRYKENILIDTCNNENFCDLGYEYYGSDIYDIDYSHLKFEIIIDKAIISKKDKWKEEL